MSSSCPSCSTRSTVAACRPSAKTDGAVRTLRHRAEGPVESLPLDLSSLASVRAFAAAAASHDLPPLRAVVCNAGLVTPKGVRYTPDGFETMFAVNHLGHFLLANLLVPRLAPPARVVFVGSGVHDPKGSYVARMSAPALAPVESLARPDRGGQAMSPMRRYATSKLCNYLCAYELDRRLAARPGGGGRVTVNVFNPGACPDSGLGREVGWLQRRLLASRTLLRLLGVRVSTAAESGADLARLVTDPALAGVSGRYFDGPDEARSSDESYDLAKAKALWDGSAGLVGLTVDELVPPG